MYNSQTQAPKEFEEKVIQVNRVSKKTKGGNRRGFSVIVVIGDKKNRVGVGLGKAPEVQSAVQKAVSYAKKHLLTVNLKGTTIPHEVRLKLGAAQILLKPAPVGTGVIAGGAIRSVVEAAGIKDIVSKVLGTNNKASNVYATMAALKILRPAKKIKQVEKNLDPKDSTIVAETETATVAKETTKIDSISKNKVKKQKTK
jgi:small subunit ribosomal protein S5